MTRRVYILVSMLVACGGDEAPTSGGGETTTGDGQVCNDDEARPCACTDDGPGMQSCRTNGADWNACVCEEASSTETPPDLPPMPMCGDGTVDDDEQCDDDNGIDDDACSNDCVARCGLIGESSYGLGTGNDFINAIVVAPDGTAWIGGGLNESGDGSDAWFAKLTPEGEEIWSRSYDHGLGFDHVIEIVLTPDGGATVVANVDGPTSRDVWIGRHDADGNPSWSTVIDGPDDEVASDAAAAGDAIVLASFWRVSDDDTDVRVIEIDGEGGLAWERVLDDYALGSTSHDVPVALAVRPSGEIVILADVEVDYENTDARVIELAADGSGPTMDVAPLPAFTAHLHGGCSIAITPDGRTWVAIAAPRGTTGSTYRLFELDAEGATVWDAGPEELGLEPGGHRCADMAVEPGGRVALLGNRPGDNVLTDLFELIRLDSDHNVACYAHSDASLLEALPSTVAIAPGGSEIYVGGGKILGVAVQPWLARFRG